MNQPVANLINKAFWAALALPALLTACSPHEEPKKAPAAGAAPPPAEVEVITVQPGPVALTHDLPGRLEAYRTAQVRARVEGIVQKRLFTEGSDVKEGAPLYQIQVGNYHPANEAAKADLATARQNLARGKQLLEGKFISPQDYDNLATKVKQAEAAYSRANEDWQNTRVPAPISGHIGRSLVTEGALVGKGEATLLATIEQTDRLYANFTDSESDMLRLQQAIRAGKLNPANSSKVELVLEDGSIYPQPGTLLFTDMAADPGTGSVAMRAEIPNPQRELLPGMFVTVRYAAAVMDNAITVPQKAVLSGAQGQYVMVVEQDGKAAPRPIKLGSMSGADFIVEEGLHGGEQVIVNGLQKARPGTPVKAVPLTIAPAQSAATQNK